MRDFDELLRACRHRKLKRWVGLGGVIVGTVAIVSALQWYLNQRTVVVEKATVPKPLVKSVRTSQKQAKVPKSEKVKKRVTESKEAQVPRYVEYRTSPLPPHSVPALEKTQKKCVEYRVLQFAVSQKRYRKGVQKLKRHLEELGLHCYTKLSVDGIHLYLRCNEPENFSVLIPYIKKARYSYFRVKEEGSERPKSYRITPPKDMAEVENRNVEPPVRQLAQTASTVKPHDADFIHAKKSEAIRLKVEKVENLETLKARFERYPSYETALRVAEIFYRRKAYDQAAAWARKANALDRDDERAWILFAKAEYAMGEKEKAKRILRIFLDYKSSKAAQALLGEWSRP